MQILDYAEKHCSLIVWSIDDEDNSFKIFIYVVSVLKLFITDSLDKYVGVFDTPSLYVKSILVSLDITCNIRLG